MTKPLSLVPIAQPVQPIVRFQPGVSAPLASAVVSAALQALVASGRTRATARAVERFVEPNALGNNVVTRLVIVTDLSITLS